MRVWTSSTIAAVIPPREPQDEAQRLADLRELEILDTAPETEYDDITRMAAAIAGTPIALVSLVDVDRQWFKSRHGLDAPETARRVSFCGHAVAERRELVIPDAALDPRFADNPLVVGDPRIRFYAGIPLAMEGGHVLGTVCVIDRVPRELSAQQLEILRTLGRHVVTLLELRRKTKALEAASRQVASYRQFFGASLDLKLIEDTLSGGRIYNPAWEKLLGWTSAELSTLPLAALVHPDEVERFHELPQRASTLECRVRRKDGAWLWIGWSTTAVSGINYWTGRDISEARERLVAVTERDERLEASANQLRVIVEALREGVVMQDATGAIVDHNSAAERLLGLSSDALRGRTSIDPRWHSIHEDGTPFPGGEHPAMVCLRTGLPATDVVMGVRGAGPGTTWLSINSQPLHRPSDPKPYAVISTFRDITGHRLAAARERILAQQERLLTTGTLAAGVGHEINNPLSYLTMNIDHARDEVLAMGGGSPSGRLRDIAETLGEAREGADRIRTIVRGLRSLVREDGPLASVEVAPVVEMALNIAMHELRGRASIVVELDGAPAVLADEPRLSQVLVNLLVNAGQAFTVPNPMVNRVHVRWCSRDERVGILVEDNGPGIDEATQARIFDPFFTTKPPGVGTGLGLSISHSTTTALGGTLSCTSQPGRGASFCVLLAQPPRGSPSEQPAVTAGPRASILVIDDEASVMRALVRLLRGDFEVTGESDPVQAWQRFASGERFDVVFCDVMMPMLSGLELVERVRGLSPAQADRFVFVTGGMANSHVSEGLDRIGNERIEKPFSPQHIRRVAERYASPRTHGGANGRGEG